ncbi:type IV conjugative transfer system lipoprotein TraV [Klebsiella pneumoniae]|nr:type IV conjugative transfer system lipoprotein TraV [Klebsiella pneumoniae]
MKQISLFIPLLGTLLLSGCAGTSTEFECNATTSDTCMTMEQANEKAKKLEQSSEAKPVAASLPRLAEGNFRTTSVQAVAASLPRLAEGNFRTTSVQAVAATTPSRSRPAVTAHPEQKLLAPRPLFTAAREVKTVVPVSSVVPVTPPRPLRTGEQTAALWIAPYIDNQDVYHQPSSVFFVIKPSAWGKPRIN